MRTHWRTRAQVWDCRNGQLLRTQQGHKGMVTCLHFSASVKLLFSGSIDNTVGIWTEKGVNLQVGGVWGLVRWWWTLLRGMRSGLLLQHKDPATAGEGREGGGSACSGDLCGRARVQHRMAHTH